MTNLISLSDLNTTINHEPRILDIKIAEALGMVQPLNIRATIEANKAELALHGEVFTQSVKTSKSGGRPSSAYYLNEAQAILLCMFSRTEKAAIVRKGVIEVFMAWRKGQLPALQTSTAKKMHFDAVGEMNQAICILEEADKEENYTSLKARVLEALKRLYSATSIQKSCESNSKQLPLPIRHAPIDAKAVMSACDELSTIIGHFKIFNQQQPISKAAAKIHGLLLDAASKATQEVTKISLLITSSLLTVCKCPAIILGLINLGRDSNFPVR